MQMIVVQGAGKDFVSVLAAIQTDCLEIGWVKCYVYS